MAEFGIIYPLILMPDPSKDLLFLHSNRDPHCAARVDKHFDGYYTLQFLEMGGGAVELWYDDRYHLLDGDAGAWFWPAFPGPRIRFHPAPGHSSWRHRYAAFQGPKVARWIADGLWLPAPQLVTPEADAAARFDGLLALLKGTARNLWRSARAANLVEGFLLELAEARAPETSPIPLPAPWLADVFEALSADLTLDCARLAKRLDMAPSTLRRRFRQTVGTPLHEYTLGERIARARALLGETDLPIKAVAERLGYHDVYFFTRQFRQRTGVPPAAYRRSRQ
ncbi:MAG: helix-turn-helix transcriptional regulator [Cytophagales bacterium]|nr:helix-turn-helix transcriptional regulator [Armatimonadota bacterium]